MGGGLYCSSVRSARADAYGYATKSAGQIFTNREITSKMNPSGILLRESRDCKEHPNSVPIIVALDVTGSMGTVPHHLVKTGLPTMMEGILQAGIPDPQVLFLAIGDHECDRSPLQVGQFESNDEMLDTWLTDVYIEGGGGGNSGESYLLAWFFADKYVETDMNDKRKNKGFLFTIGDEPTLKELPARSQKAIMGDGQYSDETAASLLERAKQKFNVYHIHIRETGAGAKQSTMDGWSELIGDNLVVVQSKDLVPDIIAQIVAKNTNVKATVLSTTGQSSKKEEILL